MAVRKIAIISAVIILFAHTASAQMGRFLPEPDYETGYGFSHGGSFLGLLMFLFLLLGAFVSWDAPARLRLAIAVVCWIALLGWGTSDGNALVLIASFFVPIFVSEPIAVLMERIFQTGNIDENHLRDSQILEKKEASSTKDETQAITSSEVASQDGNESCVFNPSLAYDDGFHDGLRTNKLFINSKGNVPDLVLSSYEAGFKDGWMYAEDLRGIKHKANSKVDLFLTLLLAFEENLVAENLRAFLVEVFHEAVEKHEYEKEFGQDSSCIKDVDFLIREIEYLLFPADDDETESSAI